AGRQGLETRPAARPQGLHCAQGLRPAGHQCRQGRGAQQGSSGGLTVGGRSSVCYSVHSSPRSWAAFPRSATGVPGGSCSSGSSFTTCTDDPVPSSLTADCVALSSSPGASSSSAIKKDLPMGVSGNGDTSGA